MNDIMFLVRMWNIDVCPLDNIQLDVIQAGLVPLWIMYYILNVLLLS